MSIVVAAWFLAVARDAHFESPAPTPILYDRAGAFLAQLGHAKDGRTDYGFWDASPTPRVVQATLALEDRNFYRHAGVDSVAVARAVWQHVSGTGRSGASTIAMQVARLQHPRPRTLWAKAVEAGTALALTLRYGRRAVLAQYLRLAPYGNNSHGIAHAAWLYFDKPLADLGWPEIALLAALPRAPGRLNPTHPAGRAAAIARANRILAALSDTGKIPPADLPGLQAQLAALTVRSPPRRPDALAAIVSLEKLRRAGLAPPLDPANPRLTATLDLSVQRLATRVLRTGLGAGALQGAVLVVRRAGLQVLADVSSSGAGYDDTNASRSPGSTLKPFIYALALDRGALRPEQAMQDRPDAAGGIGNADGQFLGALLPRQALANSRNVPAALLLRRLGLATAFDGLRAFGLHDSPGPATRYGLAMAIGALPSTLRRLVRGTAMLADGGMLGDLAWFRDAKTAPPRRVLGEASARLIGRFLSDPMARLPSFPRYGSTEYPFAVALKTGTSQGNRDAWTLAWSRDYVVGVWLGRADDAPVPGLSGARAAAPLARAILLALHGGPPGDLLAGDLPPPPGRVAGAVCAEPGLRGARIARLTEWLDPAAPAPAAPAEVRLSVIAPEPGIRIWRNPEAPPAANRLVLRASAEPPVAQVVWLVDGAPAATLDPARPFLWPLAPGTHRFQVRLPLAPVASAPVRVVVE